MSPYSQVSGSTEVRDHLAADERVELLASVIAVVLIVFGCVLAPVSLVKVWTPDEVSDSFVATAGLLIDDPAVQEALTNLVTTTVSQYVHVQDLVEEAAASPSLRSRPSLLP